MRQRDLYLAKLKSKLFSFLNKFKKKIQIGTKIKLSGGYDFQPKWLNEVDHHLGTVSKFISGQNSQKAMVVILDKPINFDDVSGKVVVLELRHQGTYWVHSGVVHIELCNFTPENVAWKNRKQGVWIESHASYDCI
jgi:hypothetical protein